MRSGEYWRPVAKLMIARRTKFIGPGCRELLARVRDCGSVRLASERMGLSYSKAWRVLNTLEAEVGFEVLVRRQGGKSGGETTLTAEGERLLARYDAFEHECQMEIDKIFRRHFPIESGVETRGHDE